MYSLAYLNTFSYSHQLVTVRIPFYYVAVFYCTIEGKEQLKETKFDYIFKPKKWKWRKKYERKINKRYN